MPDAPVTALIVDDELDLRVLVHVVLEASNLGIKVVAEAVDGPDALAKFDQFEPPPIPTIVILDNRMPGISGLDVAEELLRRVPLQHIILFSAHLTPEIKARAQVIGIDACVSKDDLMQLPDLVITLTGSKPGN